MPKFAISFCVDGWDSFAGNMTSDKIPPSQQVPAVGIIFGVSPLVSQKLLLLVGPYCTIPRDYLSDTPIPRAMGFRVSQHEDIGCDTPSPLHAHLRCDIPLEEGYLSDSCGVHSWTRVRRNGTFGARAQGFSLFDKRKKASYAYPCAPAFRLEAVPERNPPFRTPLTIIPGAQQKRSPELCRRRGG